ncbi:hypothetical protein TEA_023461 [Camellia sinensis var. sinensis]|uniref:Polyadenylate-binding protein n=1 Tax=Camellia sinensis var. sinensis TaxID=542762 RepID=A0A4S4F131_CAMSN|nr:hypothetical protein TEA_023461 [Camellia sinensis var. sinensis]
MDRTMFCQAAVDRLDNSKLSRLMEVGKRPCTGLWVARQEPLLLTHTRIRNREGSTITRPKKDELSGVRRRFINYVAPPYKRFAILAIRAISANALEILNFTQINGKPIRIMFSHRDPTIRKSGLANVFIKNLDASIDNKALHETFAAFGSVLSCKVAIDANGQSKGYGFVQFDQEEAAQNAIKRLNGMLMNDKQVYVGLFYGPITSAVVTRDANGKSRCFGFVNFQNPDDAAAAVENLNGSSLNDDKVLFVGKAQRKAEREVYLVQVKFMLVSVTDEKLKELFSEFGTITSCKIMLDPQGVSKGSGFVAFSTSVEATRAAQFAQIRAPSGIASLPTGMPGFHPGTPRLAPQQLYFGQGTPGLLPPHPPHPAAYGFQQQLLPGMRPGVAPNFIMPFQLQRQGQPGHRVGARRGGNPQQMQQQLVHRNSNQGLRYMANARNGMDPSMVPQGLLTPMMPLPFDAQRPGPVPMSALASALASASPENQRLMLGEQLFPLVERIEHENAGKVTGMLLEMDQTEVLHLIESPDALKRKVAEALDVLHLSAPGSDVGDQLGSLSLNE